MKIKYNFHSFQIAVYLTLFFLIEFLKRYLLSGFIASIY